MPKKPNSHGDMQEYVPAGNGDASGEYGDSEGSNKHFTAFKKPKSIKPLKTNRNDVETITIRAKMGDKVLNYPVNSVDDFMKRVNGTKQESFTGNRKLSFQIKTKDGNVVETEDFNDIKDIKKYFSNFKKQQYQPINDEMKKHREAKSDFYKKLGADVDKNGFVTLYHATFPENIKKINEEGFKGNEAPINAGSIEQLKPRSFFGYNKEWVQDVWSSNGDRDIMEIKIPAEYLHTFKGNNNEVVVEGNIKNKNGVWIPDVEPTSTAYDRIILKEYYKGADK